MRLMHSQVFELEEAAPEGDAERRRQQYVNDRIKKQDFSFRDCVEHEAIMQCYVQQQMRSGALDTGYPQFREGEKLPDFRHALYECGKSREYRKYLTKPHPELPLLRKACVLAAVDALKDRCMYPVGGCQGCRHVQQTPLGQLRPMPIHLLRGILLSGRAVNDQ